MGRLGGVLLITEAMAQRIYTVLVETCGANPHPGDELHFVLDQSTRFIAEWRFGGSLGFGGKFRRRQVVCEPGTDWCVNCYPEDETPERLAMIEKANEALVALCAEAE